ncbi:MAG: hypothetical protein IJU71_01515, partial [Selenomonadaceae bacterium]|nr:hypothetical protein [Selenomonadaceae bacterium]
RLRKNISPKNLSASKICWQRRIRREPPRVEAGAPFFRLRPALTVDWKGVRVAARSRGGRRFSLPSTKTSQPLKIYQPRKFVGNEGYGASRPMSWRARPFFVFDNFSLRSIRSTDIIGSKKFFREVDV